MLPSLSKTNKVSVQPQNGHGSFESLANSYQLSLFKTVRATKTSKKPISNFFKMRMSTYFALEFAIRNL
jgi:hypothetical protein